MSGERIDGPRCEAASLGVGGWASPRHTVLVFDLNALLPPDWPRLDGLVSLATFDGSIVTIDLPGRRLVVDDPVPANARALRVRFERSVTGLALVAFVATQQAGSDYWLEIDTGSNGTVILNEPLAAAFGIAAPGSATASPVNLHLDGGPTLATTATTAKLRFDGNVGLGTLGTSVLTFDLQNQRAWIQTP